MNILPILLASFLIFVASGCAVETGERTLRTDEQVFDDTRNAAQNQDENSTVGSSENVVPQEVVENDKDVAVADSSKDTAVVDSDQDAPVVDSNTVQEQEIDIAETQTDSINTRVSRSLRQWVGAARRAFVSFLNWGAKGWATLRVDVERILSLLPQISSMQQIIIVISMIAVTLLLAVVFTVILT